MRATRQEGDLKSGDRARSKSSLTRTGVLDAAVAIADGEGLDALSIRAIASRLDISHMSVYRFVSSKDELLDLVAIHIMDLFELPQVFETDWKERIVHVMSVWRDLLVAHPSAVQILANRRVSAGSDGLARLMENVLANLKSADIVGVQAVRAFWEIFTLTFGNTVFELPRSTTGDADDMAAARSLREVAETRGFELVKDLAEPLTMLDTRASLEDSIRVLLDGIALNASR